MLLQQKRKSNFNFKQLANYILRIATNKRNDKKNTDRELAYNKCNLNTVYNKSEDYIPIHQISIAEKLREEKNELRFKQILEEDTIDLIKLQQLAWNGVSASDSINEI